MYYVKYLLCCLLFMVCCTSMDVEELTNRDDSTLPACLVVTTTPWSDTRTKVISISKRFNKDIGFEAIQVFPECENNLIPFSFVQELPPLCKDGWGCVMTAKRNNEILSRKIFIHEDAPWTTIRHEIAHVAGCEHGDWRKPCYM